MLNLHRFVYFSCKEKQCKIAMILLWPVQGPSATSFNRPENDILVKDVKYLLPVKLRLISLGIFSILLRSVVSDDKS